MFSAFGISSSGQATHRFGANNPAAKVGAVISQAIAGSRAYQPWSSAPSRSANQPPANTPVQPPMNTTDAMNWPRWIRRQMKLRSSIEGIHMARP